MIETNSKNDLFAADQITSSKDDPNLYKYDPSNAPEDVVINVGNSDLMIAAPASVNDPQRVEVGDRRRGHYYTTLVTNMPGLLRLRDVDNARLEQVNKIRRIRIGEEAEDWIKEARKRSGEPGATQPSIPFNPHSDMTPLQRAAKGI
jgi:hypothetical protein